MLNCCKKITCFNNECPICLSPVDENDYKLDCNHRFHLNCLQKAFYNNIIEGVISNSCPLCRKVINYYNIQSIYKKWTIFDYKPTEWCNKMSMDLSLVNLQSIKFKKYDILKKQNSIIFLPIFFFKDVTSHINIPLFIQSPPIKHFNITTLDSNNEDLDFSLVIHGQFTYESNWYKFLSTSLKLKKKFRKNNTKYTEIYKHYKLSRTDIYFYVKDINDIETIDVQEGTIDKGFFFKKNRQVKFLFKTYIINTINNIYLINEMFKIMYI